MKSKDDSIIFTNEEELNKYNQALLNCFLTYTVERRRIFSFPFRGSEEEPLTSDSLIEDFLKEIVLL